ncbi:transporter substrate-binding domain-containing protein [Paucibacter sp. APW11]|uniref:Transporter substrate-binding domain-containing protein n=1 Tax=Roseateles aquae TaxID=3077235 RepID=A0ABU3P8J4_9BURK|nr:transporter substrate-binding domain-containing protein [Paucibacter sp. APW11]MDT8998889.1 transporter substrate-binding domain-containing protein [Paucibacter sp. APW11]
MVTTEFPPYMSEQMPEQGVVVAITRAALASQGWRLELAFRPWARVLSELEQGQHDAVLGVWFQTERERYVDYSRPTGIATPIGFYAVRAGVDAGIGASTAGGRAPLDLAGKRIATVTGYANPPSFEQACAEQRCRQERGSSDLVNLRKLLAGRVDLVLIDKGVAAHLIASNRPSLRGAEQLFWLDPPIERMPLHLGVSKALAKHQQLRALLDQGLLAIERSGELERIRQRWKALL